MLTPSPHELPALVQELHGRGTPWLPAGLGSRLHWGAPVDPAVLVLSCRQLSGIVEHNPGDFTVTVQAGTPLAELQEALAAEGQWLALDRPWGTAALGQGSIGGLVARGLAGGLRQRYLGVRDQLIGIGLLRADGTAARAGGKVVKNVAGYDLMRLFCGSWGSLGLITSLTLRTLPQPPERRGLVLQGPLEALAPLAQWLLSSSLTPERLDWWSAALASGRDGSAEPLLLLSLASINERTLEEQIGCIGDQANRHGARSEPLAPGELDRLVELGEGQGLAAEAGAGADLWLLRLACQPQQAPTLLAAPELEGCALSLTAGSGLGLAWAPGHRWSSGAVQNLRQRCRDLGGFLTVLQQPPGSTAVAAWEDAPSRALIEAVKRQFDPAGQLAPNRLPGVQPSSSR